MNPTPQSQLDASLLGKIIGYNNNSGLLYTTQNGLSQFSPSSNVIPKGNNFSSYSNKANETNTLEAMNSKEGSPPNYYEGKREKLVVLQEQQPKPFTLVGGNKQVPSKTGKIVIPKLGEIKQL